jgi:tetratricopeptide (TPR) repeat protein
MVAALAGCGAPKSAAGIQAKTPPARGSVQPAAVPDENFAASIHRLLRDSKATPERLSLLAGVVNRQLLHANDRFAAGQTERGLASVSGAFLLMRAGEFHLEMLAGAEPALSSALSLVAPRGDEGRALAFLNLESVALPADNPARRDADSHLAALKGWMRDSRRTNSLEAVGGEQRTQALRSMVEPTTEALNAARDATEAWIDQSLKMQEDRRTVPARPRREDAIEAFRAFRSGAETLTAIYLRQGDAASALAEIDRTSARKITPPSLYERLQRAAEGGDALAWRELLAWLWNPDRKDSPGPPDSEADPELAVDPNVLKGALFGTAIEAYRLDPLLSDVNIALATLLVQLGLPEAAPLVLADAAVPHPEPALLSGALGLVLQAILREDEAEDTASARRIYAATAPLLTLAARPEFRGRLEPGPGRLELAMGTIETRAGNLTAAKPLLERSTVSEPTVEALLTLAAIERQAGHADNAVALLARALATTEAKQNPLSAGEAELGIFEIEKDRGALDKAKAALTSALHATLDARQRAGDAVTKGHAERLLARVLFRFADPAAAARATERAFLAAGQDKHELAATVLDAAQRAFLRKDVAAARAAVNRGLAGDLPDDDVVYAALWLLFTERETKSRTDGTATRALASIRDDGRWPSRLAAWGLGRIKDSELIAAARTLTQKTEASFYTALARRVSGDTAADTVLAEVVKSPAIDLVEVQLARELLAGSSRFAVGPTPAGVSIP